MTIDCDFTIVRCKRGGKRFVEGKCYPMVGWNNGFHIAYADKSGNPEFLLVHNYGDELINPDDQYEEHYPIFEYLKGESTMENNEKKLPKGLLEALHNLKEEDLHYGGTLEMTSEEEEGLIIEVPLSRYEEMMQKATAFDILTAAVRRKGEVSAEIVWAVTGADPDVPIKELKEQSDKYWGYYTKEREKNEQLQKKVEKLQQMVDALSCAEEPEEGGNG